MSERTTSDNEIRIVTENAQGVETAISIEASVREIVAEGSLLNPKNVIPGNDSSPSPSGAYATVLPMLYARPGIDSSIIEIDNVNTPNEDVRERLVGLLVGTWSVQFYREDAYLRALRFHQWCYSSQASDYMQERSLSFVDCSDIKQIDKIVSWNWERRAGVNFQASYRFGTARPVATYDPEQIQQPTIITADDANQQQFEVKLDA